MAGHHLFFHRCNHVNRIISLEHLIVGERSGAGDIDGDHFHCVAGVAEIFVSSGEGVEGDSVEHNPTAGGQPLIDGLEDFPVNSGE